MGDREQDAFEQPALEPQGFGNNLKKVLRLASGLVGSHRQPKQAMQNYIDINSAFSNRPAIAAMLEQAQKERQRVSRQMEIAYKSNRSDRKEWKARYEALMTTIKGLEYLSVQVLVTSGRTPAL